MRLYGSRTSIISRRESWMLKECSSYARNITATKNRNRARQDAKKEIAEGVAPIDSHADVELKHESYSEHLFWEKHNRDYQDNRFVSHYDYLYDYDFDFDYCGSSMCSACCLDDPDERHIYNCVEESNERAKVLARQKEMREEAEAASIARIEEALSTPIRSYTIEEMLAFEFNKMPGLLEA